MMKKSQGPFRQSRRVLTRLPLSSQLAGAALCGAVAVLLVQVIMAKLTGPKGEHGASATGSDASSRGLRPRTPRAVPIVVVAAGLPRTGSTWIFNVLRILMRMRDPNSVAGWYADLIAIWKNHKTRKYDHLKVSWLQAYRSLNTSLLLKMHGPGPFKLFSHGAQLGVGANLTVITHRDLRTEVRSWVYQNWNSSIHSGDIASTPFGDPAQWLRVAEHILDERTSTLSSIGDGRYLDIRYEDWTGQDVDVQFEVIKRMADELQWRFTDAELRAAAVEAARLEAPADGAVLMYNPVNKLHPGHTRVDASNAEFQAALNRGYRAIANDPRCYAFLKEKRYV